MPIPDPRPSLAVCAAPAPKAAHRSNAARPPRTGLPKPGPRLALAAAALLACHAAWAQLPPAPTPVPGSPLDRPGTAGSFPGEAPPAANDALPRGPGESSRPNVDTRRIALGTAFRVSEAGHLVTSRHVVEGCKAIGIVVGDKAVGGLRLLATDPQNDLALLAGPSAPEVAPLRASDEPVQGEDVLSYGFPLPGMLSTSGHLGAGMVTALSGIRNDPAQLQTDVPLQPGNSGGALIDRRGHVIGVVLAKLDALRVAQMTGDLPQNINFAVRIAPVKRLLEAHGVKYRLGPVDAPARSNEQIAAQARDWTLPIACLRETVQR